MIRRSGAKSIAIGGLDTLFFMENFLLSMFTPEIWLRAFPASIVAICIWCTFLINTMAPTALLVGLTTQHSTSSCVVPSLDMSGIRPGFNVSAPVDISGLQVWTRVAHGGYNVRTPSSAALQAAEVPAHTGLQSNWPSPCGANCSYETTFIAPSWQCTPPNDLLDPAVPCANASRNAEFFNITGAWDPTNPSFPGGATSTTNPKPTPPVVPSMSSHGYYLSALSSSYIRHRDLRLHRLSSFRQVGGAGEWGGA
jgi:hypothetical protein